MSLQEFFSQLKLPATPRLDSPPPPRVSPVHRRLPLQLQRPPLRVFPPPLTAKDLRVLPTRSPPQDPRVHHTIPPPYNTPVASHTRSQAQPPPAILARTLPPPLKPIAHRTHYRHEVAHEFTAQSEAIHRYPPLFLTNWVMPVLDKATSASLEYFHIFRHPKYRHVWNKLYSNVLGRLFQCIGKDDTVVNQRVYGADALFVVRFEDIPAERRNEITYTQVVCKFKPHTSDPNRTLITIGGNYICYPGDVGTPTGSLELVNPLVNSDFSRRGARFTSFGISNFYLGTPLDSCKYARTFLLDIPEGFICEYNLH